MRALHLRHVGFAVRDAGESGHTVRRVDVKRVIFATGREHGFEAGLLYASSQHKDGPETFWPIEFHSASIETVESDMLGEASDIESD